VQTTDAAPAVPANTGTIEVRVAYAGAPVVKTISINKDVEQSGTQVRIEKIAVGDRNGLAWGRHRSRASRELPPPGHRSSTTGLSVPAAVVAMEPGELQILNSDGILHKIHTYSEANAPINKA
jgi:hypothetical protein